jgi:hypothetical protein
LAQGRAYFHFPIVAAFIGFGIQFFSNRAPHLNAMASQTAS